MINDFEIVPQADRSEGTDAGREISTALRSSPARLSEPLWNPLFGVYPAVVTDLGDPNQTGRARVRLPWALDREGDPLEAWARVATLMAGQGRGTWFMPEVDDEVLVAFEAGDARRPYIVGALWNGKDVPPVQMDSQGANNIKMIRTRSGLQITLDDSDGSDTLTLETSNGQIVRLENESNRITIQDQFGNGVEIEQGAVQVKSASTVTIEAAQVRVTTGLTRFDGVVQCDTIIANTVVGSTYTPGAGNIW